MLRPPLPIVHGLRPTPNHVRFRLSPKFTIALGASVREDEGRVSGNDLELIASHEQDGAETDPYAELLGDAALVGATFRFARQDYLEEVWHIVDPALGEKVAPQQYEPGTWGPPAAEALVPGGWFLANGHR